MCKWMEIWTGGCEIPSEYEALIAETKHALKQTGDYFCGWEAFEDGVIGHSGGNSKLLFADRLFI